MRLNISEINKIKTGYEINVKYIDGDEYYPDGKGGQLGDRGTIGDATVTQVKKSSIIIDKELECGEYDYTIDRDRQDMIAVQHTGEHIFSGIAFREYKLKNVGFRMADTYTTVDLDSNNITPKMIEHMEREVNKAILEGIQIIDFTISREEAEKKEELRKDVSDKVIGDIRFIDIPSIDVCACGGFHVKNTSEVQLFKIISYEKVKGNFTRFYFLCGDRALEDYKVKNNIIKEANKLFSSKDHEILGSIEKNLKEKKATESKLKQLSDSYAELLIEKLRSEASTFTNNQNKIIIYNFNDEVANSLHKFTLDTDILIFGCDEQFTVISKAIDCKILVTNLREKFKVKGGGNKIRASFKGSINIEDIVKEIEAISN